MQCVSMPHVSADAAEQMEQSLHTRQSAACSLKAQGNLGLTAASGFSISLVDIPHTAIVVALSMQHSGDESDLQ